MVEKQHQRAFDKFYQALCQIRELVRLMPQDVLLSAPASTTTSPVQRVDVPIFQQGVSGSGDDMFLYFHALTLEAPNDLFPATLNTYSAVILFNLAILHHMEGIAQGRMMLMDKAHQMYQASLKLLSQQDLSHNDTVLLLHLAANNNLSQIELEKGMVDAANARLAYTFAVLQAAKSRAVSIFPGTQLRGFLLNSSLQGKIASAAAA